MVSAVSTSDLNLDPCVQEPIRIPGSIQPHGTLVVVDPGSRRIVQASVNASALFGTDRGSTVLGLSLRQLLGEAAERQIDAWLAHPDGSYLRTLNINGRHLQVLGHRTAQGIVLELEQPPASEGETLEAYCPRVARFMEDLPAYEDIAELCAAAAREFRQISGFNRVLIYRFDAQCNGEVLAEDGDGMLPSCAGLRVPAKDIPTRAREPSRRNRLRVIPDVNYTPVPIEPPVGTDGKPLDLSFAALASVSPVHLQSMRTNGTLASMSISLLVDGRRWGLVSCHNATPRQVNAQARAACELLGKVLSQHIGARERAERALRISETSITERKQAEVALRDLNQTLTLRVAHKTAERDQLWQLSKDLMAVMTPSGALIEVNPAWQTSLGLGTSEVVGEHLANFAHPDDTSLVQQAVTQAAREHQRPFECRFICRDGKTRWLSWSTALGHGRIYAVGRDITEDKAALAQLEQAQEALRQAQKMEAVGQLTGGLAHDFNNLLQVVVGNIETLQRKLPPSMERLRRAADHAMAGAQRATSLTQHLLAFSRKQPLNPRPVAVNRLVAGMSQMLQRTLGESIQVETALSPDLRHVEIDSNQLEIALLNLAVNARDAMPEGGTLSIETFNLDLRDAPQPTLETLPRGEYVVINVRDTGVGMAPEVQARAFEPFFTTKCVGQATGLGLSQVYGFVRQSGGQVRIVSASGAGTSIRIYLPAAHPDAQVPEDDDQCELPMAAHRETILVVEDDPDVRAFTVETVRELGYDVLEARDGMSALNLLRQIPPGDIDLLFSDVVLPGGMNGQQLAEQALVLHPRLKVLFATGYARDVIVHHGRLDPGVQLITKPFAFDDLAARIRSVLDGQDSARHAN